MDKAENMLIDHNQQHIWNSIHKAGQHEAYAQQTNELAQELSVLLPSQARIAELGCGIGADAAFFAGLGHTVVATDFSEVVIARNREAYRDIIHLTFQVVDSSHTTVALFKLINTEKSFMKCSKRCDTL
jgi:ubiquinone/menaquinone biosynthesis C-methylase UbiE